jgi:hypothetical protein
MRVHPLLGIVPLFLASCTSQPTAPSAPPAQPSGHATAVATGPSATTPPAAAPRASGKPEIRYYEIADT